jgi:hypothetical protein
MRTALILAGLVCLGACSATAQSERAVARSICAAGYGDPALNPIRDKILFEDDAASKASMNFLTDARKPNAVERAALQQLDVANRRCWDAWDRAGTSASITQARLEVISSLTQLMQGGGTYGDFNRQRAASLTRMYAALRTEDERSRYDEARFRRDMNERMFPRFGRDWGIIH